MLVLYLLLPLIRNHDNQYRVFFLVNLLIYSLLMISQFKFNDTKYLFP